ERFLVGEGDRLALFESRPGAGQPGRADDGADDNVGLGITGEDGQRLRPTQDFAGKVKLPGSVGIGDGDAARLELAGLVGQRFPGSVSGKGVRGEPALKVSNDVETVRADGS